MWRQERLVQSLLTKPLPLLTKVKAATRPTRPILQLVLNFSRDLVDGILTMTSCPLVMLLISRSSSVFSRVSSASSGKFSRVSSAGSVK